MHGPGIDIPGIFACIDRFGKFLRIPGDLRGEAFLKRKQFHQPADELSRRDAEAAAFVGDALEGVEGEITYAVEYRVGEADWQTVSEEPSAETNAVITELPAAGTYEVRLQFFVDGELFRTGEAVSVTYMPGFAVKAERGKGEDVLLDWLPIAGLDTYRVLVSADGGETWTKAVEKEHLFPASVAIILPICIVSLLFSQKIPLGPVIPYLLGSAAGGTAAGLWGKKIPVLWLHRGLGALIIWGGIRNLCNG